MFKVGLPRAAMLPKHCSACSAICDQGGDAFHTVLGRGRLPSLLQPAACLRLWATLAQVRTEPQAMNGHSSIDSQRWVGSLTSAESRRLGTAFAPHGPLCAWDHRKMDGPAVRAGVAGSVLTRAAFGISGASASSSTCFRLCATTRSRFSSCLT